MPERLQLEYVWKELCTFNLNLGFIYVMYVYAALVSLKLAYYTLLLIYICFACCCATHAKDDLRGSLRPSLIEQR